MQLVIADLSKKYKWITKIYFLFLTNSHNMHLFKCHSENPSRHNSFEDLTGDRPLSDSEAGTSMFLLSEVCYIKQKWLISEASSRLCSKKNWREASALNLWYPGCLAYDFYQRTKIFKLPRNKSLASGATGQC